MSRSHPDGLPDDVTMPAGKPDAEIEIDEPLVRRLLQSQHPDLADLPLTHLDSGWDNVLFRLGDACTVRLPRREIAANLLMNEQTWLPALASGLPIPVPAPLRTGQPEDEYPWSWSILPWFEGETADLRSPGGSEAPRFADFLTALHRPAPEDAPQNPVRGIPLRVRRPNTEERMVRVREKTDLLTPAIEALWRKGLDAPDATFRCWLHGDLHAQNVLVDEEGHISAVIDWGDITGGDPATDLAGTWALFENAEDRQTIIDRYSPDEALLDRARGWAAMFGVVLVDSGLINSPQHAAAGETILRRLEEDAG